MSVGGGSGANPSAANNTYTTSNFIVLDFDVGDRIRNIKYKLLTGNKTHPIIATNTFWDVFIIAGQSNASGYEPMENLQSAYAGTYDSTYIWTGSTIAKLNASANNNNQYPASAKLNRFGWDLSMSRFLNNNKRNVIIIKYAINSTGLEEHWGSGNNMLTDSLVRCINLCKTYLKNNGYSYRFHGMIWYQGERDMQQLSGSANYQANLGNLIAKIRQNTTSNLKFYIIRPHCIDNGYTYYNQVRTAMSNYVATDISSYMFEIDDIYTTLHMNAAQYQTCGIKVANKLLIDIK
jgi:hypothetical protein